MKNDRMKTLIVCAGKNEDFSFAKSIGVGLVEASAGLCELLFKFNALGAGAKKPDRIIFIGTCGLYQKGKSLNLSKKSEIKGNLGVKNLVSENQKPLQLLEIYESAHCFNVEASKLTNAFYSPAECEINLNVSYETKKCNSSNYICTDENVAARFADLGLELENMESFAVLSLAKRFGISATCFLCATNFCDKNAHQSFLQNHTQAKKNLEHFLQEKNLI